VYEVLFWLSCERMWGIPSLYAIYSGSGKLGDL
jgi:hypothetical protein